jgi:hypothetical protein
LLDREREVWDPPAPGQRKAYYDDVINNVW